MTNASGFLRNDLHYAPFGIGWLRGLTPARLGVVFLICLVWGFSASRRLFITDGSILPALEAWRGQSFSMLLAFIPMALLVVRAEGTTRDAPASRRVRALATAVFLGALGYVALLTMLRYVRTGPPDPQAYWLWALARFSRSFVFGALGTTILFVAAREREARRRLHEAEKARLDTDRQLSEVRLQLLQSQIEPHFLFNSLASVKRLYETDGVEGARLLGHLRTYLEAAVRNQGGEARLGDEVDLARSFLRIFEVRMAGRLAVRVEIPSELRPALLPTFMLGTLVENAIKHGVAPKGTGGTLTLSARRCGDTLAVDVADDGVGFREHCGPGVGLSNTRARLRTLFGPDAGIDVVANPAGGVTATLRVPHRVEAAKVVASP